MQKKGSGAIMLIVLFLMAFIGRSAIAADVPTIGTEGLHVLVMSNAYLLEAGRQKEITFAIVDARSHEDYTAAHVLSAINVPEQDFEKSLGLLPKDKAALVIVYGGDLAAGTRWATKASAAGYRNIEIYKDGFLVWKEQAMPVAPLQKQ